MTGPRHPPWRVPAESAHKHSIGNLHTLSSIDFTRVTNSLQSVGSALLANKMLSLN